MVTESTTGSEPDNVPLLAIQSPGNKTDSHCKVATAGESGCLSDNGTRHRGTCLHYLKQSI